MFDFLLQETGNRLLLETGSSIIINELFDIHSTLAYSTVETIVSQLNPLLILDVQPNQGALFSPQEQVIIFPSQSQPFLGNAMIGRLTSISGDQLTIDYSLANRERTTVRQVQLGDQIANAITPKIFTDLEVAIEEKINRTGDTMTGTLQLAGDPVNTDDAATKNYVDTHSGGPAQSPLGGNQKALVNNADTDIFTFPLADGEGLFFTFLFSEFVKKTSDWGTAGGSFILSVYNNGGSLQSHFSQFNTDSQGTLNLNNFNPSVTLTAGIVTFSFNPGDVVGAATVFNLDYVVITPSSIVITFL